MSSVKRYDCDPCHEHICRFEREESENGEYILASDYELLLDRYECNTAIMHARTEALNCVTAERDELRAQVEAMRVLMAEAVPALQHISDTAQDLDSFTLAERFRSYLQAKP